MLMTAFLFSVVRIDGLGRMLTLLSAASVLSALKKTSVAKVKKLSPCVSPPNAASEGMGNVGRPVSVVVVAVPAGGVGAVKTANRPGREAPPVAEPQVVTERDLRHEDFDQHLARHPVELLQRVLNVGPVPRERGHDHRVGHLVRDEAPLALGEGALGGAGRGGARGPRRRRGGR